MQWSLVSWFDPGFNPFSCSARGESARLTRNFDSVEKCPNNAMSKQFVVIGAGSVGISTAMHLQQRGFDVSLIDRQLPATATSFGNAGVINDSSFIPLNNPGLIKKLPRLLLNNRPELRYSYAHVLKNLPWCFNFLRYATAGKSAETATALASLVADALDEHRAIMQRVGNMHRLSKSGWLKVYRRDVDNFFTEQDSALFSTHDVGIQRLDAKQIQELEPGLKPIFKSGYLLSDSAAVNNPGALLKEYVEYFVSSGGKFIQSAVSGLRQSKHEGKETNSQGFVIETEGAELSADNLVVCAGPWSGSVLDWLGYRVMLQVERGYHQHFKQTADKPLTRPLHDVDAGYIFAPMETGLRLTTGVELQHRDAEPNYSQLQQVIPRAKEAIDLGEATADPIWMGCRPTFPDSRPVIGRAPAHENLWLAFGHQHIGLMSGPVTGKLLVQMICGEKPDIDVTPFSSEALMRS